MHYYTFLSWSAGVRVLCQPSTVSKRTFALSPPSASPSLLRIDISSLLSPLCLFNSAFLSNKHTGWECRLESSAACNERHAVQNLVMTRFSSTCLTPFPFLCLLTPLHFPWSITHIRPRLLDIHQHLGNGGDFLHVLVSTPNNSVSLFLSICCTFSTLFFWNSLSLDACISLSPSLYRVCSWIR